LVKQKRLAEKREKKSNSKKPVNSDRILRKDFPEITNRELKKLKIDESYKRRISISYKARYLRVEDYGR
jgi:hypothetical protein